MRSTTPLRLRTRDKRSRSASSRFSRRRNTAVRISGASQEDPGAKTLFDVKLISDEQLNLASRPDLMQRIAEDSGGVVISDDNVSQIEKEFEQHMEKTRPLAVRRTTAWDRAWVLAIVLGIWGLTWAIRRSGGLV